MENVFHYWSFVREVTERIPIRRAKSVVFWYFLKRQHGPRCITNVMLVVISDVHMWIKSTSFNVWVGHFVWNFKGTLLNSTHNILPIQWKIWFLYNTEPLRALRFKSSNAFFDPPPPPPPPPPDALANGYPNIVSWLATHIVQLYHIYKQGF